MVFYRCKCGEHVAWSSMGVSACSKCSKCGSNLASGPNSHAEPKEHDFSLTEEVETDEGTKALSRCRYCYRSRKEIEKREAYAARQAGLTPQT